jgi:hypothetical protein
LETIERLTPKDQVTWYLIFGDCIHAAMDVYYRPVKGTKPPRSLKHAQAAFIEEWGKYDAWLQEQYGPLYKMGIEDEWHEHHAKGLEMLKYYDQFDRAEKMFDSVLAVGVEERSFVPILDPAGNELPGKPLLSGRVDLAFERKIGAAEIMDHKALASAHASRALDIDDQLTGYSYIWFRIEGYIPKGSWYNVLVKNPPHEPKELKPDAKTGKRKLSQDKQQRTTWEQYHQTLLEMGLPLSDYTEMLDFLAAKGWSQFYLREGVQRNEEQMQSYEKHLYYEYLDMKAALDDENLRYPNPSQYTCPGCPVMAICQTMEEQGDVEYIIDNMYRVQEPRYEIPEGV